MTASPIKRTWMTRLAHHILSSSDSRVRGAHFAPCVLGLFDQARPQSHLNRKAVI